VSNTVGADVAIPDRTRGHGIENMRVRAASVGGTVDISIVDRRWQVVAELPTPDLRRSGESDHLPGSPS
jgi:signal transduction histidine kinase